MTRYPSSSYSRRRGRSRKSLYVILLIIAAVNAFIRGSNPFDKNKNEASATLIGADVENEIILHAPQPILPEIAPEPTFESDPKSTALIAEAMKLIDAKAARIIEARDILNEVLPMAMSERQRVFVKGQLSVLADKWLFSRSIYRQDWLCGSYKVEPGDILSKIGNQFKVPHEILMQINKISCPEALRAGETIKVIKGPFHARVYRSTFTMDLYLQNTFVRSFPVGLGRPGEETPTGTWLVKPDAKLVKPTWTDLDTGKRYEPEDPDYPLGSRWIGLEGIAGGAVGRTGFAIHGTKKPEEIGTANSQGCIRLHNGDAILMYNLLMPGHSQVEVVE